MVLDRGKPVLAPSESGIVDDAWVEGSLPGDWLSRAALQKHVGVAFDEARRNGPSEALYTQALWESLHLTAQTLLAGEEIPVGDEGVRSVPGRFVVGLSQAERSGVASAIERMLIRLERHHATSDRSEDAAVDIDHPEFATVATFYALRNEVPYPPASIAHERTLLPVERALLEVVARLHRLISNCSELIEFTEDERARLERVDAVGRNVELTAPRQTVRRSVVAAAIPLAGQLAEELIHHTVNVVIEKWCQDRGLPFATSLDSPSPRVPEQSWAQHLQQHFAFVADEIGGDRHDFYIVGEPTSDNALLVLTLPNEAVVDAVALAYSGSLNGDDKDREQRRLLLPIVHIALDTGDATPPPTEVVEVIEEVEAQGFWARLLGPTTQRKKAEERELEGWIRFDLNPELGNIGILQPLLSETAYLRNHVEGP